MARQRDPIILTTPFLCVVFGKPRSVQTDQGAKLRKSRVHYVRWRDEVSEQIAQAVGKQSGGRGFELLEESVKVRLVWYSPDLESDSDPDLDNMAKPYVDALQKGVGSLIADDDLVRDLRILKVSVNDPILNLAEIDDALTAPEFAKEGEFVLVMVNRLDLNNQVPIAAEFSIWPIAAEFSI